MNERLFFDHRAPWFASAAKTNGFAIICWNGDVLLWDIIETRLA